MPPAVVLRPYVTVPGYTRKSPEVDVWLIRQLVCPMFDMSMEIAPAAIAVTTTVLTLPPLDQLNVTD